MKRIALILGITAIAAVMSTAWAVAQKGEKATRAELGLNRLITFDGMLKDSVGAPRFGITGVTFSLYSSQEGGDPLWRESQVVQSDEQGRYTVLLGATETEGLPLDVFGSGKAQWLGIQPEGQEEQARVLLMAVPYALKAADADTVGGKPLSSFVLYEDLEKAEEKARSAVAIIAQTAAGSLGSTGIRTASATGASKGAAAMSGSPGRVLSNETGYNTWFGDGAGAVLDPGTTHSAFFGYNAGHANATGMLNTFLGSASGMYNTTGQTNTFVGSASGHDNVDGSANAFVGHWAGGSASGDHNVAFGYYAGEKNTATGNSFVGAEAGKNNTTGTHNAFFGAQAGYTNVTTLGNSFFGYQAGYNNTGTGNTFVGDTAGYANTTADYNTYVGSLAGTASIGTGNAGLGRRAGEDNTSGGYNTFLGYWSGQNNTTGDTNLFAGYYTGISNTTENANSFIGTYSNGATGISNATAVGYRASVGASNSLVLGSINGVNGASTDTKVGIGTTTPTRNLEVRKDQAGSTYIQITNTNNTIDTARSRFAVVAGTVTQEMQSIAKDGGYFGTTSAHPFRIYTSGNTRMTVTAAGNVGINTMTPTEKLQVNGNIRVIGGTILYSAPDEDLPDYVFERDYRLMPLNELHTYLEKEKHLPNVPSAAEMKEKGLNLSEFQMRLLEKIEELTLYTVQQDKVIREQSKVLEEKGAEMKDVMTRLSALEKQLR